MSDVVVVLPFEPVMQMVRALPLYRPANSISEIMCMPFSRSACTTGAFSGMPGDLTTSSAASMRSIVWPPCSYSTPHSSSTRR